MHRSLNQDFFKKWTPEMAYVLGFFAADGSMSRNKRGGHFIEFTSTDGSLVRDIRETIGSSHAITIRHRGNGKWKTQYRLQIGSKGWFASLTGLGFTQRKSATLRFPAVPRRLLGDFVRGYFDGDGCVYLGRHYSKWHKKNVWVFTTNFTSGSEMFLSVLHGKLKGHGVVGGRIATKTNDSGYELVLSRHDSLALYRLMYHTAQASALYLPRKRRKLERAIQVLTLRW